MSLEAGENNDIQFVLEQLKKLDKGDFDIESIKSQGELSECCKLMQSLAFKLAKHKESESEYESRFTEIIEVLNSYLLHDYSEKIYVSEKGNELDALALSVNLFGEELEESINVIERQKEQVLASSVSKEIVEKANENINVLLMEVHHRVKNNLQIICSLISLQGDKFKDSETKTVLKDLQNRINSMSIVHELLYQADDLSKMDYNLYLETITSRIADSFSSAGKLISFNINTNGIQLNMNTAIPLGLIINEVVSNSFKHAFHGVEKGEISITLYGENDDFILEMKDNGASGTKGQFDETESLGMKLIFSLAKQVDGKITRELGNGTKYTLKFQEVKSN